VHYRGGKTEFRAGIKLLASDDPLERSVGADVVAQIGWRDRAFLDESVDALLFALGDHDVSVVPSVIFALGHRQVRARYRLFCLSLTMRPRTSDTQSFTG
jgi:hypothetical protein